MNKFLSTLFFVLLISNICLITSFTIRDAADLPESHQRELNSMLLQVKDESSSMKSATMILDSLKNMLDKLVKTQAKHKSIADKMVARCIEEETFRTTEVDTAKAALKASTEAHKTMLEGITKTQSSIDGNTESRTSYRNELDRANKQRDAELLVYTNFMDKWGDGLKFLKDFADHVKTEFANGTFNFAQTSSKLLMHATKFNVVDAALPVLMALNEDPAVRAHHKFAAAGSSELSGKLTSALDLLISRVNGDIEKTTAHEKAAVETHATYTTKLSGIITTLTTAIDNLTAHLKTLNAGKAREEVVMAKASSKLTRNAKLRDSGAAICKKFASEFVEATNNRLQEIITVKDIIRICKRRFGELPEGFSAYLDSTENGFKEYVNSTDFQAYINYVRSNVDDNKAGLSLTVSANHVGKM